MPSDVRVGVAELAPIIKESLAKGNDVRLIVRGISMYPLLVNERDFVVVSPAVRVKKRDVALYERASGTLVLHRVVKVRKEGFFCVGDNQVKVEGPIPYASLLGVATVLVRNGRELSVKNVKYRAYAFVWTAVRPIRRAVVAVLRFVKRLFLRKKNEKKEQ